ncbi:MAG: aminotransferase class IV, partial [Alphaproteobacteria bacterium]|nr:aminotransferase class IV [Alphaproteobacteria bacterium]
LTIPSVRSRPELGETVRYPIATGQRGINREMIPRMVEIVRQEHAATRPWTTKILRDSGCPVRDEECHARAIYEWVLERFYWVNDPVLEETLLWPVRFLKEIDENGMVLADCASVNTALVAMLGAVGIKAVFINDTRWKRRDMKTTQLLSQALAYRTAKAQGADTALMVEDGFVTEAASANAWIVTPAGEIITRDLSPAILPGITRVGVMALRGKGAFTITERAFTPDEVAGAAEVFTTSAGAMIAPVTHVDGRPVGQGLPGPVTRTLQRLYYEAMGADVATAAPWTLERA